MSHPVDSFNAFGFRAGYIQPIPLLLHVYGRCSSNARRSSMHPANVPFEPCGEFLIGVAWLLNPFIVTCTNCLRMQPELQHTFLAALKNSRASSIGRA